MSKEFVKIRNTTAVLIAILLGLFAYSLPLYAGNDRAYHLEEKTTIDIPFVGKITTYTSTYLAGCQLKESTRVKMHNPLIKTLSDSDGLIEEAQLSDLCDKVQWLKDDESGEYVRTAFADIRAREHRDMEADEVHIDMEVDQNDIDDLPRMTHEILPGKKNIMGFSCKEVLTQVYSDEMKHPIVINELYTTDSRALSKVTRARKELFEDLGYAEDHAEGVPDLIKLAYEAIREDQEWERPDGEVIYFHIEMVDEDMDTIFSMTYEVQTAERTTYRVDQFTLR
ncbi:MAG: hypothetical protein K9M49_00685 [Candidatus Marinimicrobia bacterium]|nr:hypothetical protein [Candidatus Neomarinimicrobiota bacterium]MCF7850622.1 hypothetical protein [Candidatus Neomarinimicrobiota bacterium]MCF7903644.1 hypothetical protein [Candidatus Neomarinimicrobiota bacterium]